MMFETIEVRAAAIAILVFFVAIFIAWALKRYSITDSIGFIALVILPFAAYGISSGYVSKIALPGGWGAEFRDIASAEIKPTRLVEEIDDLRIIEKAGIGAIQDHLDSLQVGKPIAISLRLGRLGYYSETVIEDYIRAFQAFDPDLTIIFEDGDDRRFVASSNGNSVLAALSRTDREASLVRAMEKRDLLSLQRLIVLSTNSVKEDTTNAEALQMMINDGVDAMVKVNERNQATGIVRRDEIISRLLVNLAK